MPASASYKLLDTFSTCKLNYLLILGILFCDEVCNDCLTNLICQQSKQARQAWAKTSRRSWTENHQKSSMSAYTNNLQKACSRKTSHSRPFNNVTWKTDFVTLCTHHEVTSVPQPCPRLVSCYTHFFCARSLIPSMLKPLNEPWHCTRAPQYIFYEILMPSSIYGCWMIYSSWTAYDAYALLSFFRWWFNGHDLGKNWR